MQRIVIAGASQAGLSAARELRRAGYDGELTVLDPEPIAPYRRPEVSKGLISGRLSVASVASATTSLRIDRRIDAAATSLELDERRIHYSGSENGSVEFDGLVIATGAKPRRWSGSMHDGVHQLHSVVDAEAFRDELSAASGVVVVGGGFIGLEVAAIAAELGKRVTVLEAGPVVLERSVGTELGHLLARQHHLHGVDIRTGVQVSGFATAPNGRVRGVEMTHGELVPADLVLISIGQEPATEWLTGSGLDLSNGVVCDEFTAARRIDGDVTAGVVAAGDAASWVNPLYGHRMRIEHWQHAIQHGAYAAQRLLGVHDPQGFAAVPYFWSDQYGRKLQAVGAIAGSDSARVIHRDDGELLVAYGTAGTVVAFASYGLGPVMLKLTNIVRGRGALETAAAEAVELLRAAQTKAAAMTARGGAQ